MAFVWTLFLAVASAACMSALASAGATSPETYRPAARTLLAVIAAGLVLLWPMIRLSQSAARESTPVWITKDLIVLLAPVHAVIWAQSLFFLASWPLSVVGATAAMLTAWTLLVAGVLALSSSSLAPRGDAPGTRLGTMVVILGLIGLGPLVGLAARAALNVPGDIEVFDAWGMTSPITGVYELTRDRFWSGRVASIDPRHWTAIGVVGGFALAGLVGAGIHAGRFRRTLQAPAPGLAEPAEPA